ncbi:MAG: caspase family protein [Terasakiella sp.]|uniref:caspase family protein n=1 Tax=unclassified Terasakiella TaxID=2614952 RepID=UPI003B005FB3
MKTLHLFAMGCFLWAVSITTAQSAQTDQNNDDVAVIIGNKTYGDQDIPEVRFAHNDAKAMKQFVQNVLNIREENIIYLEDATQAKMQSTFGRQGNHRGKAFQYVKPGVSKLYVFYSGHGLPGQHDQKSYLLPVDAEIATADINGYPTDLLYKNLKQIDAKSIMIFLDACFSGNSAGGSLITQASGASILPAPVPNDDPNDTLTVITAASNDQLASWDEESRHGLFTEYLLRALYGEADKNNDGKVKLDEVSAFLKEDMRYKARRTYNRDQVPDISGNSDRILVAAVNGIYPTRPTLLQESEDLIDPPAIDTGNYDLYPVEQNMFALKNANVRRLPTVRARKVMMLPKGEPIHVAAKIIDQPWYAVERGDGIIGYVFADLLGEEKDIATEEENRSIRELKDRLEKLEERTRLSTQDILPAPPKTQADSPQMIERPVEQPRPERPRPPHERYQQIESRLKTMGAILARQSFILEGQSAEQQTSFSYNWIRVHADRCKLSASISLHHNDTINIYDQQIESTFWQTLDNKKRILKNRSAKDWKKEKIELFKHGPFIFKSKQDRNQFARQANKMRDICPQPRHVQANDTTYNPQSRYQRPPPPPFKRQPPPFRRNNE